MDAFIDMAVSFNNKYIALFTESGMVWIGSADLTVSCYLYVTVFVQQNELTHLILGMTNLFNNNNIVWFIEHEIQQFSRTN